MLVDAYLRHYATGDGALLWAFIEVNQITVKEAERGWNIALALIERAPDDKALRYVAAGPLDDVLECHGDWVIDRVEQLVSHDTKFRRALSGVGCFEDSMPRHIRERIGNALDGSNTSLERTREG
jgi:hypothetical protein